MFNYYYNKSNSVVPQNDVYKRQHQSQGLYDNCINFKVVIVLSIEM